MHGRQGRPGRSSLELITDPLGASVEPCGWFSAQGATVPGFCHTGPLERGRTLPAPGAKSTSDQTFQSWLTPASPTYWDSFEELALNTPGIELGVRWNMVGSGPYYLTNQPFTQSVGYTLAPTWPNVDGLRGPGKL